MIIQGGTIYTSLSGVIREGYIRVRGDKITEVAGGTYTGPEEVLDARGCMVTPGFIDAHCHIGMWEEGLSFEGDDGNEETDPSTPHLRGLDAVNPLDRAFGDALSFGVTTVLTGPGSANPVAGQFLAMKTHGRVIDRMALRAPCAMKFALGENPKTVYNGKSQQPATRMAIASVIRDQLAKAQRYMEDLERAKTDEDADLPDFDSKCEALIPVLKGEIKAHFHAHRADDICTAIRLSREFGLDAVIIHGTEGYLIADVIAEAGLPVVCGPVLTTRSKPELRNMERYNAARLMEAGVRVSICTDAPELPVELLSTCAAVCAQHGMELPQALEAITINAARAAGIQDRVGAIAPGMDADILVFDQSPLGLLVKPRHLVLGGQRLF